MKKVVARKYASRGKQNARSYGYQAESYSASASFHSNTNRTVLIHLARQHMSAIRTIDWRPCLFSASGCEHSYHRTGF